MVNCVLAVPMFHILLYAYYYCMFYLGAFVLHGMILL
jgi:hypothetical protein